VCSFATIVGRVIKQGTPYAYANVIVLGTRMGTQTKDDGWFVLQRVPVGQQILLVQAIYCEEQSLTVSLRSGCTDTLAVELSCPLPPRAERRMRGGTGSVHRGCLL
jgi:hypothetical protein